MDTPESEALDLAVAIARHIATARGAPFLNALVSRLSRGLHADYCYVAEIVGSAAGSLRARTVALAIDGVARSGAPMEYGLEGTPCAEVSVAMRACAWPDGVRTS